MSNTKEWMLNETDNASAERRYVAHLPVVILLDTSGSMKGESIRLLNEAMAKFRDEVMCVPETRARMDIAVIAYNSTPELVTNFTDLDSWQPTTLTAGGCTDTAEAMQLAMDCIDEYRGRQSEAGIQVYRPILVHISDGASTSSEEDTQRALDRVHARMRATGGTNKLKMWNFSTCDNETCLRQLMAYSPFTVKVQDRCYKDVFNWLAKSFVIISSSTLVMGANGQLVEEQQTPPPMPEGMSLVKLFNA